MIYIKKLVLPSDHQEIQFIKDEKRTCFNTFYPFKIFPLKMLREIEFDRITIFYGGNGSGKSTLINVLSRKINATRYSEFNDSPFFDAFVEMCYIEKTRLPGQSYVLASDDVFDYVLKARTVNENIEDQRNELIDKYTQVRRNAAFDPEIGRLNGIDDYERWSEVREILSPKRSQSSFIKKRVASDIALHSNGETAMLYFIDKIEDDAVYFLDEPENSLSIERQIELAEYIAATALCTKSQFIIATHSPIFLSMNRAKIYNLDSYPAGECKWTELPNVRKYFEFFMKHRNEFE
ncbi:MAG: AAA family ATPase [Clostridia bacterium]|nr:AAA family ATPase [Clostridia bacterium]